jgi:DNA-binding NtrC family response regulator
MNERAKIMMVEDSESLSAVYSAYLADRPYDLVAAVDLESARKEMALQRPDIVLLDIELPDGSGMDLLDELVSLESPPQVIVMTAHGTSDMAVESIRRGAFDFLTKPFDASRLQVTVENAVSRMQLGVRARELASLQRENYCGFIGKSLAMQAVYKTIDSLATSSATGFIVGESGTGKELAAEAIHKQSDRSKKPFIAINCGAIPSELMESELFGHVKGAYTGAISDREGAAGIADGGTLFLDEVCEMSLELQKKLLRFIQTGTFRKIGSNTLQKVDVRFVCATNRDPIEEVRQGRFREDLFYRLHVVPVRMPPLRERDDDLVMIASHFLQHFNKNEGRSFRGFKPEAVDALKRYPWPGNVRQLQNAMHQLVVLHDGEFVERDMLAREILGGVIDAPTELPAGSVPRNVMAPTAASGLPEHRKLRETVEPLWLIEKKAIEDAIDACGGNVNRAAGLLEVAPSTLYRKLTQWREQRA